MQELTNSRQGDLLTEPNGTKRPPGRPRNERSRRAIIRSTLRLLRKTTFADLSIEAIAADAGVGKATVYRWWTSKGALVVDAFVSSIEDELHFPDSGSVQRDMSLQMKEFVELLNSPVGRIVAALLAAGQHDPELMQEFRARFLRRRRQEAYQTLQRGIDRGELPHGLDLDLILDLLYGGIYMRFLIRHDELSERYVGDVCRVILQGASTLNGKLKRRASSASKN
jgi:AcrR family transcriptional regulator